MRLDKSSTILSPGGYPGMGSTNELPKQGHFKDGGTRPLARGLRRLRLDRDSKATSYGFTMSGDSDNGTGFFISGVTPASVAERHGLKAGDQLLEVGGWSVSGASHSQVAEVVQRSRSVTLLLRDVGVIPVKDSSGRMAAPRREGDPLTWVMVDGSLDPPPAALRRPQGGGSGGKMVTHYGGNPGGLASAPPAPSNGAPGGKDTHLLITIPTQGRSSLGFSIKHDHNGFCVATVKPDGPAWRAGLRHSDQILTCNGKDLSKMDHKMAVVEMKKHPHIVMEVRRPFKKPETRAGESSGYNSSASSTTGDQTPPVGARRQAERRPKERVTSRLSAVSHRLEEREQQLRSVEGEWANAEAAFKRRQLASHHPHRDQTKQSGGRKGHPMSRSASDLLDPAQYDSSDRSVYYTSAINPNTGIKTNYYSGSSSSASATAIRPASSTTNLLNYQEVTYIQSPSCTSDDESSVANTVYSNSRHSTIASQRSGKDKPNQYGGGAPGSHKIALVTTCDPHVNNIVVTATRHRDEKDAVSRLEQLSCSSNSSSLQTGCPKQSSCSGSVCHDNRQVDATESVDRQLKLIQEQKRLLAEQEQQLVREKTRFEEQQRRGTLLKTNSAPLGAVVIPCVGDLTTSSSSRHNSDASSTYSNFPSSFQRHLSRSPSPHCSRSPPSPTPSSASARHTSRIHIKSSPPAPPKRNTSTTLTRQHRDCCCGGCCHHNQHHPSTRAKHSSLTRQKPHHHQQQHCYDCNTGSGSRTYSHNHHHHHHCHHSPPSSPSSSSGISCGSNPHHNSLPRRCKSFDELSHSSNEDTAIWDDIRQNPQQLLFNDKCQRSAPKGNIPPPPLPNLLTQSTAPARTQPKMSSSTSSSSTPSLTPPSDTHKSDLASALTLALQKRKIEASNTGDDSEKADAYQAKIDAYKKEKVVPKDAKKMQLEKLMEEFKQKHSKMFNADDEPSSSSSASPSSDATPAKNDSGAPKLESFTILKTELSQMNVIPRKAASPVRTPSTLASGETATPKKIPLGYTKSQAPAPPNSNEQFSSKIVMRSQSSTLKNVPEKRHTVHVSSFKEEDGEGENTNPLQYWKKKDDAVKKPRPTTAVVVQSSTKTVAPTIVSFNSTTAFKKNPLAHTAVEIKSSSRTVQETVIVEIPGTPDKLSASDLIKTFNASSSTLKKNSDSGGAGVGNVSNIYLNKLKPANTRPKAPQPEKTPAPAVILQSLSSTTTIVEKTKPPVQVNWVPASTNTNRSSHLVKQQVSPDNIIHGIPPPPPLPPNYSKQQSPSSSSYQSLSSTSLSSASYQSSPSPPHQEAQHYSPISISIGGGGPSSTSSSSSHSNYSTSGTPKHIPSSSRTSKDGGYYGSSSPIAIVGPPPADSLSSSFDNISPSDLIIPRPPSPMSYSTVIPKGVPPPPRDSWSERFGGGHNSSIVHISHSTTNQEESSAEEKSFQKRFNANDNTSTNFKALFTGQKSQEEKKPLVRIDSYSSNNSRPGPRKIDFLAASPAAPSFQEEEEDLPASDVDGEEGEGSSIGSNREEGSSIGSNRVQFQSELSNTLTRSNLRQRYSPHDSSVSSSDSESGPSTSQNFF